MAKRVQTASIALGLGSLGGGAAHAGTVVHGVDGLDSDQPRFFRLNVTTGEFTWLGSTLDGQDIETLASLDLSGALLGGKPTDGTFARPGLQGADALSDAPNADGTVDAFRLISHEDGSYDALVPGTGIVRVAADGALTLLVETDADVQAACAAPDGCRIYAACGTVLMTFDTRSGTLLGSHDLAEFLEADKIGSVTLNQDGGVTCSGRMSSGSACFVHLMPETGDVVVQVVTGLPIAQAGAVSVNERSPVPASLMMMLAAAVTAATVPRKVVSNTPSD